MGIYKLIKTKPLEEHTYWYCISCEKEVAQFNYYCQRKELIPSYFIRVNPDNGRICKDCLAAMVKEGTA